MREVEAALQSAYERTTSDSGVPMKPSSVVEEALRHEGWQKTAVWAPEEFGVATRDSFDAWKAFEDSTGRIGVAAEVEWVWERWFTDFFKFWRGVRGGQIALGFEILYGPDSLEYLVHRQYPLYRDLFPDLRVIFCALDSPDLREPQKFLHHKRGLKQTRPYLMP
jgi:hypothetical protein